MPKGGQITNAIAVVTIAAWLVAILGAQWFDAAAFGGFIPARVFGGHDLPGALPWPLTPLSATLIHADLLHLAFNMLMLVWCGRQVEQAIGGGYTLLLYGVGAYAAALGQFVMGPHQTSVMVGASGAISALMAFYALVFSEQKVRQIGPIPSHIVRALWLGAAWVGLQMLIGLGFGIGGALIAVGAHIGGFIAGLLLARPLLRLRYRR
ncbi:rhomboid family intramembrane serine protease [Sphingomonas lacunae]|uniref:rhomboid family intramembrane serine protease n=1 Tax=Sphingomonas lacunae TaxID=2698828 RepID=UPI001FE9342F|nr:rhomboid family intramembrane serine protease [Sphingomonas lacunae]